MTAVTAPKGNLLRDGSAARDLSRIEPVEVTVTSTAGPAGSASAANEEC